MTGELPTGLILALVPAVALIAAAYASVGLGGGTGYLAVLTLVGAPAAAMAPTALLLNLVVTGVALLRFGLAGRLRWERFLPFLIPAMPAAFVGGLCTTDVRIFAALLAAALTAAGVAMLRGAPSALERAEGPSRARLASVGIPAGLAIGFLSGFLGVGGGVFLGPLLLLLGWAGPKEVAAMNSAFVLTLSAIALGAHGLRGTIDTALVLPLAAGALVGGLVGSTLAEAKLSPRTLQRVFAVIVLVAAAKAAHGALTG